MKLALLTLSAVIRPVLWALCIATALSTVGATYALCNRIDIGAFAILAFPLPFGLIFTGAFGAAANMLSDLTE